MSNSARNKQGTDKTLPKNRPNHNNVTNRSRRSRNDSKRIRGNGISPHKDQLPTKETEINAGTQVAVTELRQDSYYANNNTDIVPYSHVTDQSDKKSYVKTTKRINDLVQRRTAVALCAILLKIGVTDKKEVQKQLEANGIKMSYATFSDYYECGHRIALQDKYAVTWLTEKAQQAQVTDYMHLYQSHDRFLEENENHIRYCYEKAKEKAKYIHGDDQEDKYPEFLDIEMVDKLLHTGIVIMNSKKNLMSKGLVFYRMKRFIDWQNSVIAGKQIESGDSEIRNDPIIQAMNKAFVPTDNTGSPKDRAKDVSDRPKRSLRLKESSLGKVGVDDEKEFKMSEHLKEAENQFGELSDLE